MEHGITLSGAWWKAERKPPPSLPHELWALILRWATLVPGALDTEPRNPFATPPSRLPPKDEHKALRSALVTKRYVVRVCKTWRELASPYLYEAVCIELGRVLRSLADTLTRSKRNAEEQRLLGLDNSRPLGWCTKRLDIRLRKPGPRGCAELTLLADIVECLPNLAVLELSTPVYVYDLPDKVLPPPVAQALVKTCMHSLRVMHIGLRCLGLTQAWPALLRSLPELRSIEGTGLPPLPPLLHGELPQLRALTCSLDDGIKIEGPSLRELRCWTNEWDGRNLIEALAIVGRRIERLYIIKPLQPHRIHIDLRGAGTHCPNLSHLAIDASGVVALASIPPSVTHLGLHFEIKPKLSRVAFEWLFYSLATLDAASLRVIRVLHSTTVKALRCDQVEVLREARKIVRFRGWRLEDDLGQEL